MSDLRPSSDRATALEREFGNRCDWHEQPQFCIRQGLETVPEIESATSRHAIGVSAIKNIEQRNRNADHLGSGENPAKRVGEQCRAG